jgi:hypothetical protein
MEYFGQVRGDQLLVLDQVMNPCPGKGADQCEDDQVPEKILLQAFAIHLAPGDKKSTDQPQEKHEAVTVNRKAVDRKKDLNWFVVYHLPSLAARKAPGRVLSVPPFIHRFAGQSPG